MSIGTAYIESVQTKSFHALLKLQPKDPTTTKNQKILYTRYHHDIPPDSSFPFPPPHSCTFSLRFRSLRIAPGSAGSRAPLGGEFLAFQVSQMVSMVTHSTPSNLLMFSMCLCQQNKNKSVLSRFPQRAKRHDLPLEHHQAVRMAAHIRVHRHGVHEALVVLAVEELEPVHPHLLDVARVHPAVAVGRCCSIKIISRQLLLHATHPKGEVVEECLHVFLHFLMNIIGGKSSAYQLAGISHRPVVTPGSRGFIQWSGCLE